jgi:site-specific DNA recombinase
VSARRKDSGESVKRAVYLLRVSTARQMHTATDIDAEGNSVPTQRKHCDIKCKELGAIKVDEYIEDGYSGQAIEKRLVFRELMKRVTEKRDVDYIIIYMRSRIFRNYVKAGVVKTMFKKLGVKVISAKENFSDDVTGEAMEAMTDVFNWMNSKVNGADVKLKMLNKAQAGGTVGRAKLGYLNVRAKINGNDVNTIEVDADRSPYIVMAFELAATGKFKNVDDIRAKITAAGLRMHNGKPVSLNQLYRILQDRYYCGYVTYQGIEYPGRHTPLISEDLFERARKALDTHSGTGVRLRSHPHYLKGSVWCNRCKRRFIVQRAKGRNGGVYFYFFCTGRQDHICDHPYVPVEVMEQAVINHYTSIGLPETFRAAIRALIDEAAADNSKLSDDMRSKLAANLTKLDRKESYFLNLAAEEDWPTDKLREQLDIVRDERKTIEHTLEQAENRLDDGAQFLTLALELMTDPHAMYQAGSEAARKIMNRSIFAKLYVDGDTIIDHEMNEPFNVLTDAYSQWQGYPHQTDTTPSVRKPSQATGPRSPLHTDLPTQRSSAAPEAGYDATGNHSASPAPTLAGQGSSKNHMVELLRRYSNRPQPLKSLVRVMHLIDTEPPATPDEQTLVSVDESGPRVRPSIARTAMISPQAVVEAYRAGATQAELAARHGVSDSTIKRLLRDHGARKQRQRTAPISS